MCSSIRGIAGNAIAPGESLELGEGCDVDPDD